MKFLFFFLIFYVPLLSTGQKIDKNATVAIKPISFHSNISSGEDFKIVLGIKNVSDSVININKNLYAGPNRWNEMNIGYELFYLDSTKPVDVLQLWDGSSNVYGFVKRYQELYPSETFLFQSIVPSHLFYKFGNYKIRFIIKHSHFKGLVAEDVYSNWIYINRHE